MANVDAAFGFRPIQTHGSTWTGNAVSCVLATSNAVATFVGDIVRLEGGEDTTDGISRPTIDQIAATEVDIYGVIVGFEPNYADLTAKHRTASTRRVARVVEALPGVIFEAQLDEAWTAGDVGLNADVVVGTGDTTTGRSAMEIDNPATGAAQLKVINVSKVVGQTLDTSAAGTIAHVLMNETIYGAGVDGA